MANILTWKQVTTRKPHRCFGCAKEYPKGSEMVYASYADNGTAYSGYWCPTCQEYMHRHFEYGDETGYGDIFEGDAEGWNKIHDEIYKGVTQNEPT